MNQKKVLITGSNGFIGKHLTEWIKSKFPGAAIYETVRRPPAKQNQKVIDITDADKVRNLINSIQPNYIFHLAGSIRENDWASFYEGNVKTTINLLAALKESNISAKVIVVGSAAEYGEVQPQDLPLTEAGKVCPMSLYGISKLCQTQLAQYYSRLGVSVVVARLFNAYGAGISRQLSIGAFREQINKIAGGEALPRLVTGNLSAKRDFLYIDDICAGLVCIAEKGVSGEIYNLCSGSSVSMQWMVEKMLQAAGLEVDIAIDPDKFRPVDVPDIYGSYHKLYELAGWQPAVSLVEGIFQMMQEKSR